MHSPLTTLTLIAYLLTGLPCDFLCLLIHLCLTHLPCNMLTDRLTDAVPRLLILSGLSQHLTVRLVIPTYYAD
jgi:hypothetical protein